MRRIWVGLLLAVLVSCPVNAIAGDTLVLRDGKPLPFPMQALAVSPYDDSGLDVPYVPTPHDVVEEMLKVARVGKDDILYDLGSGDGRIVITAAKKFGTRGIGVDLDPRRVEESRENASRANVADRVTFRQQDLFETDLREATVVTLYLLSTVNLQLRPKLLRELRPGTRLVSHDFDMNEWEPDQTIDAVGHTVYYWVIPANVSGTWEWTMPGGQSDNRYVMQIEQEFQQIKGTITSNGRSLPVRNAHLTGDRVTFTVDDTMDGQTVPMLFEGRVDGHTIKGSMEALGGRGGGNNSWEAQRDPSTVTPLDDSDTIVKG